jgi:hypothetical protein
MSKPIQAYFNTESEAEDANFIANPNIRKVRDEDFDEAVTNSAQQWSCTGFGFMQ